MKLKSFFFFHDLKLLREFCCIKQLFHNAVNAIFDLFLLFLIKLRKTNILKYFTDAFLGSQERVIQNILAFLKCAPTALFNLFEWTLNKEFGGLISKQYNSEIDNYQSN